MYRVALQVANESEDVGGVFDTTFKSKNDVKVKDRHKVTAAWSRAVLGYTV